MDPIVLFSIQFTLSLVAYLLIGFLVCRAPPVGAVTGSSPHAVALGACLSHRWRDHSGSRFGRRRSANGLPGADWLWRSHHGGAGPGGIDRPADPLPRRDCVGLAVPHCWNVDTVNAIIQSTRDSVFSYALGFNWVIVALYVPALLVSSLLMVLQLVRSTPATEKATATAAASGA